MTQLPIEPPVRRFDWVALFLSGEGRIGRGPFWAGFVILFVAWFVAALIPILGQLVHLAMIWCWIVLYTKRLHDLGRSGWWQIAPLVLLILFVGALMTMGLGALMMGQGLEAFVPALLGGGILVVLLGSAATLSWFVMLLWLGLAPGEREPNQYGLPAGDSLSEVF